MARNCLKLNGGDIITKLSIYTINGLNIIAKIVFSKLSVVRLNILYSVQLSSIVWLCIIKRMR